MNVVGYYYLHENGQMIYKPYDDGRVADFRESPFVRAFWPVDPQRRETAWQILVEALAAGANPQGVTALASKWGCTDVDAAVYASMIGVTLDPDGNQWCAKPPGFVDLQSSKAGFGSTCLEAMADLAKMLGFRPSTFWGMTFQGLLKREAGGEAPAVGK